MTKTNCFATALTDLALIEATGEDASSFLQGQLSNDISALTRGQACLAAYCTPKGRMLASMVVWKAANEPEPLYRALVKRDIAPAIVKRLSMFVLRAKVKITLSETAVSGVVMNANLSQSPTHAAPQDVSPQIDWCERNQPLLQQLPAQTAPYTVVDNELGTFIAAPQENDLPARWWFVGHDAQGNVPELNPDYAAVWAAGDIAAGLPWVEATTQDVFIPQTLNFDLIGGVSFTKGCYPGQEVVARSHYRGTVKRRMARGLAMIPNADISALAGQDTFDVKAPDAPAGRIVNAVSLGDQVHLLLEVRLSDIGQADLRVQSANGSAITLLDLPYSLQPDSA